MAEQKFEVVKSLLTRLYKEPTVISKTEEELKTLINDPDIILLIIGVIESADNLDLARMAAVYLKRCVHGVIDGTRRIETYSMDFLGNINTRLTNIALNYSDEKVIYQCALTLSKILSILYPNDMYSSLIL